MDEKKETGTAKVMVQDFDKQNKNGRIYPSPPEFKFQFIPQRYPAYPLDDFGMNQILSNIIADMTVTSDLFSARISNWSDFVLWLDHNGEFISTMHSFLERLHENYVSVYRYTFPNPNGIRHVVFAPNGTTKCVILSVEGILFTETITALDLSQTKTDYVPLSELMDEKRGRLAGPLFTIEKTDDEEFYLNMNTNLINRIADAFTAQIPSPFTMQVMDMPNLPGFEKYKEVRGWANHCEGSCEHPCAGCASKDSEDGKDLIAGIDEEHWKQIPEWAQDMIMEFEEINKDANLILESVQILEDHRVRAEFDGGRTFILPFKEKIDI